MLKSVTIPGGVTNIEEGAFADCSSLTDRSIPGNVTDIGREAFKGCSSLISLAIPDSVTSVGESVFVDCLSLDTLFVPAWWKNKDILANAGVPETCTIVYGWTEVVDGVEWRYSTTNGQATIIRGPTNDIVVVPSSLGGCPVVAVGEGAFRNLAGLAQVVIPDGVTTIGDGAFAGCVNLEDLELSGSVVDLPLTAFDGCNKFWASWLRKSSASKTVSLTVTNVIVHYVTTSVPSAAVTPSTNSTGIVNIIAEVTAGGNAIAISPEWAAQYPAFEATFGSDFSAALTADTGKRDGAGKPVHVWQDYVAGTDPTDPASLFTASVTYDAEGAPLVSWSPELPQEEASKRLYSIYGRVNMTDPDWTLLATDAPWHPFASSTPTYNFYLVTVEMK